MDQKWINIKDHINIIIRKWYWSSQEFIKIIIFTGPQWHWWLPNQNWHKTILPKNLISSLNRNRIEIVEIELENKICT